MNAEAWFFLLLILVIIPGVIGALFAHNHPEVVRRISKAVKTFLFSETGAPGIYVRISPVNTSVGGMIVMSQNCLLYIIVVVLASNTLSCHRERKENLLRCPNGHSEISITDIMSIEDFSLGHTDFIQKVDFPNTDDRKYVRYCEKCLFFQVFGENSWSKISNRKCEFFKKFSDVIDKAEIPHATFYFYSQVISDGRVEYEQAQFLIQYRFLKEDFIVSFLKYLSNNNVIISYDEKEIDSFINQDPRPIHTLRYEVECNGLVCFVVFRNNGPKLDSTLSIEIKHKND